MDKDKVIKGLDACANYTDCATCGYTNSAGLAYDGCMEAVMRDALALLKAQEPVEPVLDIDIWECGNCGHTLEHQQLLGDNVLLHEQYNFCPNCGRAVKWE